MVSRGSSVPRAGWVGSKVSSIGVRVVRARRVRKWAWFRAGRSRSQRGLDLAGDIIRHRNDVGHTAEEQTRAPVGALDRNSHGPVDPAQPLAVLLIAAVGVEAGP